MGLALVLSLMACSSQETFDCGYPVPPVYSQAFLDAAKTERTCLPRDGKVEQMLMDYYVLRHQVMVNK